MAVSYVGASALYSSNSTSIDDIAMPSGTTENDLVLAFVLSKFFGATWPTISWSSLGNSDNEMVLTTPEGQVIIDGSARYFQLSMMYKLAESTPLAISRIDNPDGGAQGWGVLVVAYRGVDTTTPFDATNVASDLGDNNTATQFTPDSITTVTDGAMVISAVGASDDNTGISLDTANSFSDDASGASYGWSAGNDGALASGHYLQASAGTPTMPRWAESVGEEWVGLTVALREDGASPGGGGGISASRRSIIY